MILLQLLHSFSDVLDWTARIVALFGTTGMGAYFANKKWKSRAAKRIEGTEAEVVEALAPDRIKTSSITNLETQFAVSERAWESERGSLYRTIEFQDRQIEEARAYGASRDAMIVDLRSQVEDLQSQLSGAQQQLESVIRKLSQLELPSDPRLQ